MKQKTIGIFGLGLFGTSIAQTLAKSDVDVIAIDSNMDHVEAVMDDIDLAVQGDFTNLDQVKEAGFAQCDEVVIASAERLENSILAIINLQKLGVERITAKTKNDDFREVLLKVGATKVILPEAAMGVQTANLLTNPTVMEMMQLDSRYNIIEFPYNEEWIGKNVAEIDFRNYYDVNIIAIQPGDETEFTIEFGPQYTVTEGDIFIGVTTDEGMEKLADT